VIFQEQESEYSQGLPRKPVHPHLGWEIIGGSLSQDED
jgi:hypothetical protein